MKREHLSYMAWGILCSLLLISTSCNRSSKKVTLKKRYKQSKISKKEERAKLTVTKVKNWGIVNVFQSQNTKNKTICPSKNSQKKKEPGHLQRKSGKFQGQLCDNTARLRLGLEVIAFDIVYLEESQLDIPSFKQFKNNRTDFTASGQDEFAKIITQIRKYLGENTDGKGVTLKIWGSASQIPTSYDPSKPRNNIRANGGSIKGQTSIENNKMLAHARARSLSKEIANVFDKITILTPHLHETTLGATKWTREVQRQLDKAYLAGDQDKIQQIYAPFQKEQFVKVESHETFIKTIQPNAISMYNLIATPRIVHDGYPVKSRFIISKETYLELSKEKLAFDTPESRIKYLNSKGYDIEPVLVQGEQRWYITKGTDESLVVNKVNDYERILESYKAKMIDKRDYRILEEILTQKELDEKRYKYIKAN